MRASLTILDKQCMTYFIYIDLFITDLTGVGCVILISDVIFLQIYQLINFSELCACFIRDLILFLINKLFFQSCKAASKIS